MQTLTLFFNILKKLKFECASKSTTTEDHQDEDTKQKSKSIKIYFMSPEMFVSIPTFRRTKHFLLYKIQLYIQLTD